MKLHVHVLSPITIIIYNIISVPFQNCLTLGNCPGSVCSVYAPAIVPIINPSSKFFLKFASAIPATNAPMVFVCSFGPRFGLSATELHLHFLMGVD